jgi:hypothetical protein
MIPADPLDLTEQITFQDLSPVDGGGCADIFKGVWDFESMKTVVCSIQNAKLYE